MKTSTATRTMQAIVQHRYGPPARVLHTATVDRPEVGDDDVLVRMRASSVNTPDWIGVTGTPYVLRLRFGLRRPPTPIRGTDLAGVVEEVGRGVTDLAPGDEVFGSAWADSLGSPGTFAQFAVAPATQVLRKPAELPFTEAAAAVMSGLTALAAMRDATRVRPGARVLINGASGGVGTFAVQIARVLGAEVTGVCSTGNVDLVRSLGAQHVIDYTERDFTQARERYDVVLDNVLNHPPSATARVLAADGVLLPNSVGPGRIVGGLPRIARAALLGLGATTVRTARCEINRENLAALATLLRSGDVRTVIGREYPLAQTAAAVEHMLTHHARGNIAITM